MPEPLLTPTSTVLGWLTEIRGMDINDDGKVPTNAQQCVLLHQKNTTASLVLLLVIFGH
jgi:hypothetical protein